MNLADFDVASLLGLGGAAVGVVAWIVRQDRRIEDQRKDLANLAQDATTKIDCAACQRGVDERLARVDKESALVVQQLAAMMVTMAEVKQMLSQLQADVSTIAIQQRQPLPRQATDRGHR